MAERWKQTLNEGGTVMWINMDLVLSMEVVSEGRVSLFMANGVNVVVVDTVANLMAV